MFKYLKLRRFRNEIINICKKNGYKLLGDISIHDGASFRYLLEHPDEERKFSEFGE